MPFNNQILGGEELVRSAIRSRNFQESPQTGWRITRDGNATFQNVDVGSGTITGATIATSSSGDRIVLTDTNELLIYDSDDKLILRMNSGGLFAGPDLINDPTRTMIIDFSGGVIELEQILAIAGSSVITIGDPLWFGGWFTFDSFLNGWSDAGFSGYKLTVDGDLQLSLFLSPGTTADGTAITQLPSGFRPDRLRTVPVAANDPSTSQNPRVNINSIGELVVFGLGSSTSFLRTETVVRLADNII